MSLYGPLLNASCSQPCDSGCSYPPTYATNELCIRSCPESTAIVYPPPVCLTFPGPIMASCPQYSEVYSGNPLHSIGSGGGGGMGSGGGGMGSGGGGMGSGGGGMGSGGGGMGSVWGSLGGGSSCGGGIYRWRNLYRNSLLAGTGRNYLPFSSGYYRYRYGNYGEI
ncbi:claw keratin-like [Apus apus]|uniref:claw keratin-like n=1 Tax=Apus apus TaxID=8895 RepID=UPI0021F8EBAB|nr:claw keratin-like [Apus apus]